MDEREYTVGAVAELAGTSVRTLHHYDRLGLLVPSGRSPAGYRVYSEPDLQRLQQILFYRELDFGLDRIAEMLADPGPTAADHLRRQRLLLAERITRQNAMITAIERELEARKMGISLTPEQRFEVFGDRDPTAHAEQAELRWGKSPQWNQARDRTSQYSKEDWLRLRAEISGIHLRILAAMRAGVPATDESVMDLAEQHRLHVSRWQYDCDHETHRQLAELYLSGQRLGRGYEDMAPGLARYMHDAMVANHERWAATSS